MLPDEERVVEVVALDIANRPVVIRQAPLSAPFAFALHHRVEASRHANNIPGAMKRAIEQIERVGAGGVMQPGSHRFVADLLPCLDPYSATPSDTPVA